MDVLPHNRYRVKMEDSGQVVVKERQVLRRLAQGFPNTETSAQWVRAHLDPTIQDDTALWETENGEYQNYDTTGIF